MMETRNRSISGFNTWVKRLKRKIEKLVASIQVKFSDSFEDFFSDFWTLIEEKKQIEEATVVYSQGSCIISGLDGR